jgi:hypothetical protein
MTPPIKIAVRLVANSVTPKNPATPAPMAPNIGKAIAIVLFPS